MRKPLRLLLFAPGVLGIGALLVWAVVGLPDFGASISSYGALVDQTAVAQRHATNVVAAVVFDYRGIDTYGEELIVLAAAFGVVLLLREARAEDVGRIRDEAQSDLVRAVGLGASAVVLLVGIDVVAHGYVTPGGGFQGGVVIAAAFALAYLAGGFRQYRRLTPIVAVDAAEGTGAAAYGVVGVLGLVIGVGFLANVMPGSLGSPGTLASSGSIVILNAATALEVAAAFVLLFREFVEELEAARLGIA